MVSIAQAELPLPAGDQLYVIARLIPGGVIRVEGHRWARDALAATIDARKQWPGCSAMPWLAASLEQRAEAFREAP